RTHLKKQDMLLLDQLAEELQQKTGKTFNRNTLVEIAIKALRAQINKNGCDFLLTVGRASKPRQRDSELKRIGL
ncbi:MAG: hypothetical protein PHC61_14525, partial [Chitinivibrionales bacterium]|nr:hypothetical protein [Chitinivibrionales bacterium]